MEKGFAAPIWMTFKQALELGAHVRKGKKGSLVVYADTITRNARETWNVCPALPSLLRPRADCNMNALRSVKKNITDQIRPGALWFD